ncbi:DNA polymerase-3 subunit beta [Salinibacter ruber]|uniref:DNA polymerase III subunit beta n=1 Tax=Salinibacter ruber TaxID=146919 RepID=UPI00216793BD|nr:DNA polymerase III subunit beta [Salinibacter ruber]MCS3633815.1 DNA polymerase-3 subunit beta [Salinibacter ruber]MCS3712409.1 DNA polymerase-3 subunit beta [Salinibacter ruber]
MKFTASSADLLEALNTVKGAVPSKSTMPILECILFERDGDTLRLSATDLEISIIQTVPVQFEKNGTPESTPIAVPAQRLIDTLRALPDLPIEFAADSDFEIRMDTDQGHYKMVGHDGSDYPELPELEEQHEINVEGGLLGRSIDKTAFAVSQDALRPAMMGVYFQVSEEETSVVATDGHRLVKLTLPELRADTSADFIVPEKATKLAGRIVEDDEICTVRVDDSHVSFEFGESRVLARLIDETYPNYHSVIPDGNDRNLVVNREDMLNAVKRVGLYSSSMTNQIRLDITADTVTISAEDVERSSEAEETIHCDYDNEPMEIGFNSEYLTEVLSNVECDEVVFELSSPNRAGIVLPREGADDEDILMLIMPVMLNTYA